jgi:hypothetical protein
MEDLEKDLHHKVGNWLKHEGYPLEFRVAHRFREAGFKVLQGTHLPDAHLGKSREIDVIGLKSLEVADTTLYFVCLVECKWSKNKPWIFFSSSDRDRGGSPLISTTIASHLGEAVLHILAADEQVQKDPYFKTLQQTAYGGRVAFTKDSDADLFYSTVQSVVSKSMLAAKADDSEAVGDSMPDFGSIIFPVIVVEGEIFQATYNPQTDNVDLTKCEQVRLRWSSRGTSDHAINIVRFESLATFVGDLAKTINAMLDKAKPIIDQLAECFAQAMEYPEIPEAQRGYFGVPELLIKLDSLQEKKLKKS